MKVPECTSRKTYYDDYGCYEYDCDADPDVECPDCLCAYKTLGGRINPYTKRKTPKLVAFILYGRACSELSGEARDER